MDRSEKAKRARAWLSSLRLAYKRDEDTEPLPKDEYGMNIIDALDVALDALAPPIGSGHCSWVFLPDPDLMPYEHIEACTALSDKLDGLSDDDKDSTGKDLYNIWITDGERRALEMAVLIYKSVLFDVNQPTIAEKVRALREKEGE